MPSIYQLKPAFQNLLRPVTRGLAAAGVTANQVTLAALGLSCLAGAVIAWQPFNRPLLLLIPLTLILRMALNAIDGMLAREHDMKSRLGALLNELGDVLSDSALYLPLAQVPGFDPRLVVSVVVLSVIVELTGVAAVQIGAARNYAGPMGKSDRAFVFGLITLLLGLNISPGLWVTLLLGAMVLLSAFTIYNRARRSLAEGAV
ncbi:MAG TPA: CDP-alcohol phosphatidyltransferase family protein [Bryobacteraceae bacterium]|nr:CDP-alcohol phosphatidyltransferase family protein [Bryobacteraceae bacterium]